jgi:hypothetical protein
VGPRLEKVDWGASMVFSLVPGVLGAEADDAQEGSGSQCFEEIGHT